MKAAVVVFPGSNCDRDTVHALAITVGAAVTRVWHTESFRETYDLVILPGGFSFGDHLRTGAIAARSPVMDSVKRHAASGRPLLGICNGFQILTESGLLPGALLTNDSMQFICKDATVRVDRTDTAFTGQYRPGEVVTLPVAHGMGHYVADQATLDEIEEHSQIVFRYCDTRGQLTAESNPNGSARSIAGLVSRAGNVLGMMPHPERNAEALLGSADGARMFTSLARWFDGDRAGSTAA